MPLRRGSVDVAQRPDYIFECNCSLWCKTGARWGYFHPSAVSISGDTKSWCRADKADPTSQFHFCGTCGSATHFSLTDSAITRFGNTVMGVNLWLAESADLAGIELRFPDGRSWSGEGEFGFVRPPRLLD